MGAREGYRNHLLGLVTACSTSRKWRVRHKSMLNGSSKLCQVGVSVGFSSAVLSPSHMRCKVILRRWVSRSQIWCRWGLLWPSSGYRAISHQHSSIFIQVLRSFLVVLSSVYVEVPCWNSYQFNEDWIAKRSEGVTLWTIMLNNVSGCYRKVLFQPSWSCSSVLLFSRNRT